jgi:large subunit ribosomal protein L18
MSPHGSRYRVPLRRRREKKTDYQARKGFVVSGKPRLVARSSLKNTVAQIIVAKPHGDEVLASAHTKELVNKYGWKAATGNVPAAYLTGLLCGLKAKKNGVSEAILDLGLVSPTKGSKVFSTMSGVVDAGVEIPHDKKKIIKGRTRGEHIQEYAEGLGAPEEYTPQFSTYLAKGLPPEKLSEHFVEVRNAILTAYGAPIPQVEAKPAKAKKPEAKAPKAAKAEAESKPKAAAKPKPEAKAETKKAAPANVKAETVEAKPEAEPKSEAKKPEAQEAEAQPAQNAGEAKE